VPLEAKATKLPYIGTTRYESDIQVQPVMKLISILAVTTDCGFGKPLGKFKKTNKKNIYLQ